MPSLHDTYGQSITEGTRLALHFGDERRIGTVRFETIAVVDYDEPTGDGVMTCTLRHDPQGDLQRHRAEVVHGGKSGNVHTLAAN